MKRRGVLALAAIPPAFKACHDRPTTNPAERAVNALILELFRSTPGVLGGG